MSEETAPGASRREGPAGAGPGGERDGRLLLISTAPPSRSDRWLAMGVVGGLVAALVAVEPFAQVRLDGTQSLIPAYLVAVLLNQLITAVLLMSHYAVQRSRRVLVLSAGYLFAGLMIIPWALTFPGAFPAFGLDARLQATATIAAVNRLGFPLFVLVYALLPERSTGQAPRGSSAWPLTAMAAVVAGTVAALTVLVALTDTPLPPFMRDAHSVATLWRVVPPAAIVICAAGLVVLRARLRSVLDLWLLVVLASIICEVLLLGYLSDGVRLSLGWWAGRVCGLVAASIVLVVLLSGTTTLYARLARSVLAERRARESRLTTMEALSASIAHEIRQPLSSVVLSAAAGLRWLRRDTPDLAEVEASLQRIQAVGERAGQLLESIRMNFKTGAAQHVEVDVNRVIEEVIARCREETELDRIALRIELGQTLPAVAIDPLQLQLVLSNLISNALDSMREAGGRMRVLRITTRWAPDEVLVSVADNGTGLPAEHRERIFNAYFTTKAEGSGIGLMFCRSIIEANGGRIWAADNIPHGAVLHFALPAAPPRGPLRPQE
ncbi:ATP-binding protein [Acuticoccus sediminis]|uniref:ATP-binding protein n=1 Tax=Acuticoccus sediminis TaxID=2184697 RepID=UPI0011B94B2B|nr:ATP-binding protein [Acuticoccus sediminis]